MRGLGLGAVMVAAALMAASQAGAKSVNTTSDEWAWLEDVHGARQLDWVKAQNEVALKTLKADPDYQKDYDQILAVLDATDRIPYVSLVRHEAFNFWQDAQNPKGIWRVTSIADYARPATALAHPARYRQLAADEKENWVYQGRWRARLR